MDEDNRSALEEEVLCVSVAAAVLVEQELCMKTLGMGVTGDYICIYIYLFHV